LIAVYWIAVNTGKNESITTAMVFLAIITSNILLTLENRSFYYSIVTSWHNRNRLIPLVITVTTLLVTAIFLIPAWRAFFKFEMPGPLELLISISAGTIFVVWFEGYKWVKRKLTVAEG
jgi:Ca2+-transporting ATPase